MTIIKYQMGKNILIDCREFIPERLTGIGRVLKGLIGEVIGIKAIDKIFLAVSYEGAIPSEIKNIEKIILKKMPPSFLISEKYLSDQTKQNIDLFISPYPKLPLFGCHCPSVHIIHDILDLTYPIYQKRIKSFFDIHRLKRALKHADLTWYDSKWSMEETSNYIGITGKNPRIRYPGIDDNFIIDGINDKDRILNKYALGPGYILVLGNGMPHKNLGVLLKIINKLKKKLVFAGVIDKNQDFWRSVYPAEKGIWINQIEDIDLPSIYRNAFCLAQPSTMEGYGYPPLEAMACGIPAVVSNIPVLIETTGGNALIADPDDPRTWLEAFNALENKDIYQNQVKKGLTWVTPLKGRKGWQKHISDIEELIEGDK